MEVNPRDAVQESTYDFYRCYKCGRLITLHEEVIAFNTHGNICPCGSRKYSPANPRWNEWLLPRFWVYLYLRNVKGEYAPTAKE